MALVHGPDFCFCALPIVQIATAVWVYLDARHYARQLPDEGIQPWLLLLGTLCVWIVVFPLYLLLIRPGYQRKIDDYEYEADRRRDRSRAPLWKDACPHCGGPMAADARLCPHCNTVRQLESDSGPHPYNPTRTADDWDGDDAGYRCLLCLKPMNPMAHNCPHCGADQPLARQNRRQKAADHDDGWSEPPPGDPLDVPHPDPDAPPPPKR